mmetsp:Transcript_52855/g.146475  ORF Transcript_52855/g.146475 Transcript_52855/m.146475 type:complete len:203 (-) Transcript_52855:347-955(-)
MKGVMSMLRGTREPSSGGAPSGSHIIWGSVEAMGGGGSSTSGGTNPGSGSQDKDDGRRFSARRLVNRALKLDIQMLSGSTDKSSSNGTSNGKAGQASLDSLTDKGEVKKEDLPSIGSAAHANGTCKPCLFLYEPIGCNSGYQCTFCHLPHNKKNSGRLSKGKRDRFRKLVNKMGSEGKDPPSEPLPVGPIIGSGSALGGPST